MMTMTFQIEEKLNNGDEVQPMRAYGYRGPYRGLGLHLYVTFVLGSAGLLAQVGLFVWIKSSLLVSMVVMPLPTDDTTPPVTKMYFGMSFPLIVRDRPGCPKRNGGGDAGAPPRVCG